MHAAIPPAWPVGTRRSSSVRSGVGAAVDQEVLAGDERRLCAAGFKEEEILEAIQVVAIYNSNNRINNALGMQPNDEARPGFQRT